LSYGRRLRLHTADAENFHVNLPVRGRAVSRSGSGELVATSPGEGLIFSPGAPAEISWSADCEQLCLMIPRACLEAELEHLLGRTLAPTELRLRGGAAEPGGATPSVLELVIDELDCPTDLGTNPVVGRHIEGLVLDGLLLGQPHNHSDTATRPGRGGPGAAIRRAIEVVEERPGEPWSTVRLATEVHLSVRALQEGFSRDMGTPPMTYLRQVRLRRAHETLRNSMRDTTTVRAVATSLGFMHMGRFAAACRDAFGESPSETLNRHPS
jgi:AraC-like DNA-binding protein